jgi:hypothetical protein
VLLVNRRLKTKITILMTFSLTPGVAVTTAHLFLARKRALFAFVLFY